MIFGRKSNDRYEPIPSQGNTFDAKKNIRELANVSLLSQEKVTEHMQSFVWLEKVADVKSIQTTEGVKRRSRREIDTARQLAEQSPTKSTTFKERIFNQLGKLVNYQESVDEPETRKEFEQNYETTELSTLRVTFSLSRMANEVLGENANTFLRNFERKTGIKDTSISVGIFNDEQVKILSPEQQITEVINRLKNAQDVLVVDHGWTGDKDMSFGEQENELGEMEGVVIPGKWLQTLPENRRNSAVFICADLLGQGDCEFSDEIKEFGQEENATAWCIIHSLLGVVRPDRNNVLLGHSMGGGTDLYLAARHVKETCLSVLSTCPSYNNPENFLDPNEWNNAKNSDAIKKAVSVLISGGAQKLHQLERVIPGYTQIEHIVAEAIVNVFFLRGLKRADLIDRHIENFLSKPAAAEITAKGSRTQKGLTVEEWIYISIRHKTILWGFAGDAMCRQHDMAYQLPNPQEYLAENTSPIPYYIFPDGNHYSFCEREHRDKLHMLFSLQNQLTKSQFDIFSLAQYEYYLFLQGNKNSGEKLREFFLFFTKKKSQQISTIFNLSPRQIDHYFKRKLEFSQQNNRQMEINANVTRYVDLLLSNDSVDKSQADTPRLQAVPEGLIALELMFRTIDRFSDYVNYNDERLLPKTRATAQVSRKKRSVA